MSVHPSSSRGSCDIRNEFYLRTGPFTTHVTTKIPALIDEVTTLYEGHPLSAKPLSGDGSFNDFHIVLDPPSPLRRWYRPQVEFSVDGVKPFRPLPLDQATPMFEWGLNWCVSTHVHQLLVIHAAVIEREGRAVIMPGIPGAGKSTLTAALVNSGWRLLSDELALISLDDGLLIGLARPISLKNESIDVMRRFVPSGFMSRIARDTVKGAVALMKPPAESVARVQETAKPAWIIFPKFERDHPAVLEPKGKASIFMELARNSFNYSIHGARGFRVLADIIDACTCYKFTYGELHNAIAIFERLEPPW